MIERLVFQVIFLLHLSRITYNYITMKYSVSFVLLVLFTFSFPFKGAAANFKIPSGTFDFSELEAAKAEAKRKGEPISYVYGNPNSTCPLHNRDAEEVLSKLKSYSVVVFVNSENKQIFNVIPPPVATMLGSKDAGNIIPKAVTADVDGYEVYALMPNKGMTEKSTFTLYKKDVLKGENRLVGEDGASPKINWYLKDKPGSYYDGAFVSLKGEDLTLSKENDKKFSVNLNTLTPASIAYAKYLGGRSSEEIPASPHIMEAWTSVDGRSIQAAFVKIENDSITLEKGPGQQITFAVSLLSSSSQARARMLAALDAKKVK